MSESDSGNEGNGLSPGDSKPLQSHEKDWEHLADRLPKIIRFRDLCRCGDEIWIENEGQLYRLRRTKQGKLILTK